jgi:tRNA modification GTPase
MAETIVAIATPLGRSGIGVIRLSGPSAVAIAAKIAANGNFDLKPRVSSLRQLTDLVTGETIDEGVVTYFKSPKSFTGEDVIEISCHGSPIVLRQVLDHCLKEGARLAEPGEFSLRALANGRMNLSEAEAIRDLIDAQSVGAARQAVRQMRGAFSHELQPLKDELLDIIVVLESALEFVEDDLPATQKTTILARLESVAERASNKASTYQAGKLIRDGIRVALVGRPNVGKSSLFNALVGHDHAIVTEIAGTTRDQLHQQFTIGNIPISLIDTAGLRETSDTVESIGVERSKRTMADADLVIVMLDASDAFTDEDREIIASASELKHLLVINKIDKTDDEGISNFKFQISNFGFHILHVVLDKDGEAGNKDKEQTGTVLISAKTGVGLDRLREAMIEPFAKHETDSTGFLVSDARHFDLLVRASEEIAQSADLLQHNTSEEIVLIGLHNALRYLGQITGETTTEDMLTRIFSTFCIGK